MFGLTPHLVLYYIYTGWGLVVDYFPPLALILYRSTVPCTFLPKSAKVSENGAKKNAPWSPSYLVRSWRLLISPRSQTPATGIRALAHSISIAPLVAAISKVSGRQVCASFCLVLGGQFPNSTPRANIWTSISRPLCLGYCMWVTVCGLWIGSRTRGSPYISYVTRWTVSRTRLKKFQFFDNNF